MAVLLDFHSSRLIVKDVASCGVFEGLGEKCCTAVMRLHGSQSSSRNLVMPMKLRVFAVCV